jgi:serine/threonine-protein kinase
MTEIQPTLSPGVFVAHYQIISVAGAGGMGVVYKALDQKLQRTVALKFLPSSVISNTREKDRFLKEARAASSLDHPNIGVIYGVEDLSAERPYIVMAFYDGQSLGNKIREGSLSCQKAIDIALQVALGLGCAHTHRIVHRDIKPSNIMITPEGVAKIVDFGLAGLIKSEIETASGEAGGTIGYMSPEQTLGRPVDQRTDIWAWAVVLVEMLTGRNPFWRDSIPSTVDAILAAAPKGIEQTPALVQPIIYHALAKNPQDRYQSCAEILSELGFAKDQINSSTEVGDLLAPTRSIDSNDLRKYIARATGSGAARLARKRKLSAAGSMVAVALFVALLAATFFRDRFQFPARPKHIAVLPFDAIGNDPANDALAAGLMETMAGKLSNLDVNNQSLWVVPASEVRRRNITDPSSALRDLGVSLAVKGSIVRQGNDVQLTTNLIDARNLRQVGSVVVANRSGDLSALQDETVARLARLMDVVDRHNSNVNASEVGKPAAYEEYLKAVGYMQRYDKPGNLDRAIESLERATQEDASFVLAYAQLGEAYRLKYQLDQNPKWLDDALSNCRRAVEIDKRVTAVYVTLGRIHEMSGKHELAVQEFQRALDFNPRDTSALDGIAHSYENAGHTQEAEAAYKRAVALRPDYWDSYEELGLFYDRQGKYPEAVAQLLQAASLTPDNAQVYSNLGATYSDASDPKLFPKAEEALKKSIELGPSYSAYANLGNLYYMEKRYAESAAMTEKALQLNGNDYLVWNNLVAAYKCLNKTEKVDSGRERLQEVLERAVRVKPQDALAQSLLAILYAEKKHRHGSLIRIENAQALAPNDPQILENVGIAYEKLGDRLHGMMYIGEALKKGLPIDEVKSEPDLQALVADPDFSRLTIGSGPANK